MALVRNDEYITVAGSNGLRVQQRFRAGWKHVPFIKDKATPTAYQRWVKNYGKQTVVGIPNSANYTPPPPLDGFNCASHSAVNENLFTAWGPTGPYATAAYNKAYAKFKREIYEDKTSSLGVSVAEGKDAISMIIDRTARMGKAYKALRKGRFREFLFQLAARPKEKHKKTHFTRPKDASALWLEYWLGWAPLVGDIHASMGVLTDPNLHPPVRVKAGGRVFHANAWTSDQGNMLFKSSIFNAYTRVSIEADVKVINMNTHLRARLGLNNYAEIVWAVVPFSFVVDWFANIGDVLASFTDFAGLEMTNQVVTCKTVAMDLGTCERRQWGVLYGIHHTGPNSAYRFERVLVSNLPRPRFAVHVGWDVFSPSRAATAVSLLLSIFTKG